MRLAPFDGEVDPERMNFALPVCDSACNPDGVRVAAGTALAASGGTSRIDRGALQGRRWLAKWRPQIIQSSKNVPG